jgi:hypothetical protein
MKRITKIIIKTSYIFLILILIISLFSILIQKLFHSNDFNFSDFITEEETLRFRPNIIASDSCGNESRNNMPMPINQFGFRGNNMSLNKNNSTLVIGIVGDSFVFGSCLYENETKSELTKSLVNQYLKKNPKNHIKEIEVINLGIPGLNLKSCMRNLKWAVKNTEIEIAFIDFGTYNYYKSLDLYYQVQQHKKKPFIYKNILRPYIIIKSHISNILREKNVLIPFINKDNIINKKEYNNNIKEYQKAFELFKNKNCFGNTRVWDKSLNCQPKINCAK